MDQLCYRVKCATTAPCDEGTRYTALTIPRNARVRIRHCTACLPARSPVGRSDRTPVNGSAYWHVALYDLLQDLRF